MDTELREGSSEQRKVRSFNSLVKEVEEEEVVTTVQLNDTQEKIQEAAPAPGTDEWKDEIYKKQRQMSAIKKHAAAPPAVSMEARDGSESSQKGVIAHRKQEDQRRKSLESGTSVFGGTQIISMRPFKQFTNAGFKQEGNQHRVQLKEDHHYDLFHRWEIPIRSRSC